MYKKASSFGLFFDSRSLHHLKNIRTTVSRTRDITRRTETAGSMSFRLKWMNKLDEDVYIVYNSILIRFNFLQCHFFKCLPYKIPAGHKIFFQYPDHSQSQIEDGYRKEITFLFSYLLIHCLYSCCGSLAFTIICCIVFTCVVDPWYLQLFADPLPL